MHDNRSPYQIAVDFVKKDYDFYSKQHDESRTAAAEITLEALSKLSIPIQPAAMAIEGECPICGNENEYGLYCSECGQRINTERIEHEEGLGEQTAEKESL
jgi:methionyl-tRNA synthetase